jgi:hypothetical protein
MDLDRMTWDDDGAEYVGKVDGHIRFLVIPVEKPNGDVEWCLTDVLLGKSHLCYGTPDQCKAVAAEETTLESYTSPGEQTEVGTEAYAWLNHLGDTVQAATQP